MDAASTAAATATASSTTARARLSDTYDTFLTLLTAQLENQDPLSPMDSTQFTEQLVQYSQVEQQIRTNDQLGSLVSSYQAATAGAALSYLGKTAVVEGDSAALNGAGAAWTYELDEAARTVNVQVKSASGRVVYETAGDAGAGAHAFTWDGRDANGAALAPGVYSLDIEAENDIGEPVSASITTREEILGVDFSGATPLIITPSGTRDMGAIRAILDDD